MDWNKVHLDLDILKHKPRDIHEETGLFEHTFCLLSLLVQIRPAAFAETQQQKKQRKLEAFQQTCSKVMSSLMQKMSKRLCHVPVL